MSKQVLYQPNCQICFQSQDKLYSISDCTHQFCKSCCIQYISTKANNFSQSKCLQQGCNKPLVPTKQIYSMLPQQIKQKIAKFTTFKFYQNNPDYKTCKKENCDGKVNIKDKILLCLICQQKHCKKCYELWHRGQCKKIKEEQEMIKNKFMKCPKCSIWVQKTEGCEYIYCKCETAFCYRCGAEFSKDPCRNKPLAETDIGLRKAMRTLQFECPQTFLGVICFIPKITISVAILLPLLFILCYIIPLFGLLFLCMLVVAFGPLLIIGERMKKIQNSEQKCCTCCFLVVLYPLISLILLFIFLGLLMIYPCCRDCYHHGIYDPYDKFIAGSMNCYLSIAGGLFSL